MVLGAKINCRILHGCNQRGYKACVSDWRDWTNQLLMEAYPKMLKAIHDQDVEKALLAFDEESEELDKL